MSTGKQSQPAARRRGELHRADGNRQVGHPIGAQGQIAPGTRAGDRLHVQLGEQSGLKQQSPAPRIDTAGVCQVSGSVRSRAELCVAVRAWAMPCQAQPGRVRSAS
jgi:hypothetical protein